MGMHRIRDELEDLSFEILNYDAQKLILNRLNEIKKDKDIFENLSSEIKNLLNKNNINSEIFGREKTPFPVWKNYKKKEYLLNRLQI